MARDRRRARESLEPLQLIEAEVALRLGEVDEAERLYRAHLQPGDPARATALAGLGQIAFRAEQIEQAIELLEQALAARKGSTLADPGAVDTLGRAYAIAGAMESSIALFERARAEAVEAKRLARAAAVRGAARERTDRRRARSARPSGRSPT